MIWAKKTEDQMADLTIKKSQHGKTDYPLLLLGRDKQKLETLLSPLLKV
jgi:hypothetical protein